MKKYLLLLSLIIPQLLSAEEITKDNSTDFDVIVIGSRIPIPINRAGPGITVITQKQIEAIKPIDFVELLRTVPGITINQSGAGKLTDIYLRGGNTGMTMITVDGIPLTDSAFYYNSVDLSSIALENIESVEIVKGPLSASFGSGATNGVINIITKKGEGKILNAESTIQSSLLTANYYGLASVYGRNDLINYRVSGGYNYDEGISSASSKYGNTEKDHDSMGSVSLYLGITPIDELSSSIQANYTDRESALDNGPGAGMDNTDYLQRSRRVFVAWNTKYTLNDIWEPTLKLYYIYQNRAYGSSYDFANKPEAFIGNTVGLDFQNNIYIIDQLALTTGINYSHDMADISSVLSSKNKIDNIAGYLQATVNLFDAWTTILAIRGDKNGNYDFSPTYRVTSSYDIKPIDTQLKIAVGTGHKTPTLYQAFDPQWGNRELKPEKSLGYEVGFKNGINENMVSWGATWFDNYYNDIIIYGTYKNNNEIITGYYNLTQSHTRGVEAEIGVYPIDELDIVGSYTWTQTFDEYNRPIARRPEHQFKISAYARIIDRLSVYAEVIYRGKSVASQYDAENIAEAYTLLNATITYEINKTIQVYMKGTNLTDSRYEEVTGYGTKGVEVFVGVKLKI